MELKSWETVSLFNEDLKKAVAEHNGAIEKLYRNGKPIYADEIMLSEAKKARATLTAKLDQLTEKAAAIKERAEAVTVVALADPYSWLDDDDLRRASLLRPFVAEDVAGMGLKGISQLSMDVKTGKRILSKPMAWLLMREAELIEGAPTMTFLQAAAPPDVAKADKEAQEARRLIDAIAGARPEYQEHIQRDILGHANYDATGQPVGQ